MTKLEDKFGRDSLDFLEIAGLLQKVEPSSYYGRMYFKDPKVFSRGEESSLKEHFSRLNQLNDFLDSIDVERLKRGIRELKNIQASIKKIETDELPNVVDFFEIKRFCYFYRRLYNLIKNTDSSGNMLGLYNFVDVEDIWQLLDPKNSGQFYFSIDSDYATELGRELEKLRSLEREIFLKISERLQKLYELPVSNRTDFVLQRSDMRNQGLKRCDNVIVQGETAFSISYKIVKSDKDVSYAQEIEQVEVELSQEDIRYRGKLKEGLKVWMETFSRMIETIKTFDRDVAMAEFGRRYNGSYPVILSNDVELCVKNGRNLGIESFCLKNNFEYDRLTIQLKSGSTIITGANMGGKTSALKTVGQLYMQCVLGLPVSAEYIETCLFDGINCVFRTAEEEGLSGFAMEVMRINKVFSQGVNLNLIDEFGSATNPREGSALAASAVDVLDGDSAVSLFVTHFSKPLEFGSVNYQTGFLKENISDNINAQNIYRYIDHHLKQIEKTEIPKAAIQISKSLGLPDLVVKRAEKIYREK